MYPLTSNLPAPYELNTQPQPQMEQGGASPGYLAKGGRPKHRKMVIAHFNPDELNVLDHLQGSQERCPKTGLRSYSHLEEVLKNPHITQAVQHFARKHHAIGGSAYGVPELEHLAEGGRRGDTELGLIGPYTHHLFNQLAGGATQNPHTGHPEYFSLGGALGGLWNKIKGGAGQALNVAKGVGHAALPYLKPLINTGLTAAGTAAGGYLGGPAGAALGAQLGGTAGHLAGQLGDKAFGGGSYNPTTRAIGQGLGTAAQAYHGGASPTQALGQGLQHVGNQFQGGMGGALQGAGNSLRQGQGWRNTLTQGAQQGFRDMGGMNVLGNAAKNIAGGFGNPGGVQGSLRQTAQNIGNKLAPNPWETLPMTMTNADFEKMLPVT